MVRWLDKRNQGEIMISTVEILKILETLRQDRSHDPKHGNDPVWGFLGDSASRGHQAAFEHGRVAGIDQAIAIIVERLEEVAKQMEADLSLTGEEQAEEQALLEQRHLEFLEDFEERQFQNDLRETEAERLSRECAEREQEFNHSQGGPPPEH
jgi:hypothetical protein